MKDQAVKGRNLPWRSQKWKNLKKFNTKFHTLSILFNFYFIKIFEIFHFCDLHGKFWPLTAFTFIVPPYFYEKLLLNITRDATRVISLQKVDANSS